MITRDVALAFMLIGGIVGIILSVELWRIRHAMKKRDVLWKELNQAWREIDDQIEKEIKGE